MSLPIEFSAEASAEFEDAAAWYESRRAGYGQSFLAAVDDAIDQCSRWPGSGSLVEDLTTRAEVRRAPIARFPFHVAYLVGEEHVLVLAIAHDRRRPGYWSDRIG